MVKKKRYILPTEEDWKDLDEYEIMLKEKYCKIIKNVPDFMRV